MNRVDPNTKPPRYMINDKRSYEKFYTQSPEPSYGQPSQIVKLIPTYRTSGTVLDLGSGDGRHALFLAEHGFEVTALDTSEAALAKLRALAKHRSVSINNVLGDVANWRFDCSYDVVVASMLFQHLSRTVALRVLKDMKRITLPNGLNAVSLFTNDGDRYRLDHKLDPTAFYPDNYWIKEFYRDWEILAYESSREPLIGRIHPDGTVMTNVVERILARRPTNQQLPSIQSGSAREQGRC